MKILVTGASGYLGQGIVKHLLDNNHSVIAIGRKPERIDKRAEQVATDIFTTTDPYKSFGEPDVLLHLAWRDGFVHYSDAHIDDLPKHYQFIKNMIEGGVRKIAVMGSMHEIGFMEGSINETTPCHPVTPYGVSKNILRELTEMLCIRNDVKFQWLRGYYIVGNSQYGSSIFSKITAAEAEGRNSRSRWGRISSISSIMRTSVSGQRAVGQDEITGIINICSGYPEKLADRVERYIKENGYAIKLKYGAFPDRPYDSKAVWGDSRKIEAIMKGGHKDGSDNG